MKKIKILIADDIVETIQVIRKILSLDEEVFEIVGEANNGEEVINLIPKVKPDVILMDINMPILNGLEATEIITNKYPNVSVIIMSVQGENEYLKKAMFYGAKEYIIKPFNYDNLTETIKMTYERYKDTGLLMSGAKEALREGKTTAFFSSKGGVGKSVLALNTAINLSKRRNVKVLLMDMDLQFGDISILVNQYSARNILDAIDEGQTEGYENLEPYLYKYNENLDMIFAPGKPEAAEYISKGTIENIIKSINEKYDYIIIDTGVTFDDNTLYLLDYAHQIIFVSTMEIVALKNSKLGLNVMKSLGYDGEKVKLVINKMNNNYGISIKDVESTFQEVISGIIPQEDKTVNLSVNKGQPFCDAVKYNRLKVGKAIDMLCQSLFK